MNTKHASVHDRRQSEVVEHLAAIPPDVRGAVLSLALVVESVHLRDLPRLVVPANEGDAVWISNFVGEKEKECFDGVVTAVDEVACVNKQPTSKHAYKEIVNM